MRRRNRRWPSGLRTRCKQVLPLYYLILARLKPHPSKRDVIVLLPRVLELLATKLAQPQSNASPCRMRHDDLVDRSEEHTSELQSLTRISYAVFCLNKKNNNKQNILRNIRQQTSQYTRE